MELSPGTPDSPGIRWVVHRSRFPFGIGEELGQVTAPDKRAAEQLGATEFGAPVVARSLLSLEVAKREAQMPGDDRLQKITKARARQNQRYKRRRFVRPAKPDSAAPPRDPHQET